MINLDLEDGRIYPPELPVIYRAGETVPPWLQQSNYPLLWIGDVLVSRVVGAAAKVVQYRIQPLRPGEPFGAIAPEAFGRHLSIMGQGRGVLWDGMPVTH